MTTLSKEAVEAAIRLSYHTREAAHAKGLIQEAVNLEVQLLQETADNGAKEEDHERQAYDQPTALERWPQVHLQTSRH